jgi:hypothetical protein
MRARAITTRRAWAMALGVALALGAAACGDDDDDAAADTGDTAAASAASVDDTAVDDTAVDDTAAPLVLPDDACTLVPTDEVEAATGLALGEPAVGGDERRGVCTYSAADSGGVGVTVGVEPTDRFDEKAEASRTALGVEGEPVDGLGDEALSFFTDVDFPEGLGGVLVLVDGVTIDVTVQGAGDEASTAAAGLAIAQVVISHR